MEVQPFIILGIKVKPGPIERHKVENFKLESTVTQLKTEAGKKANLPFDTLELIHHGKILNDAASLTDCGVRCGEMVHVVKKKVESQPEPPPQFTDPELQQLVTSLRTFGCTPSAPGWTRAMQALNDDSTMSEILTNVPALSDDCVSLSIIHEVELLAALGASVHTMRRAAAARPAMPAALRELARIVRARGTTGSSESTAPTSGYAYSLEALSEDEDGEEEEEGAGGSQPRITREQLAVALQAATGGVGIARNSHEDLLRYLRAAGALSGDSAGASDPDTASRTSGQSTGGRPIITPDMFNEAITEAISMSNIASNSANTSSEQSSQSADPSLQDSTSTSAGAGNSTSFVTQLQHMHEMGLLDDRINIRALLVSGGDVNAAINLVFSGAMED